jgi:hypothetical protein
MKPAPPFLQYTAAAALAVVLIHWVPKDLTPYNPFRLLLTLAYFAALLFLLWQLGPPRTAWLQARFERRFRDCPPTIDVCYRNYLNALDRLWTPFSMLMLILVASVAVAALALWFPFLYGRLSWATGWLGPPLAFLGLLVLFAGPAPGEALAYRRQLHDQLRLLGPDDWRPLTGAEVQQEQLRQNEPPVGVVGPDRFRAAGCEWAWPEFFTSAVVFGRTGSGKTSCVLHALLDGLLGSSSQSRLPASALVLDAKGDFNAKLRVLCRRLGRERDLLVLDPVTPQEVRHYNPLDCPDSALELAGRFGDVMETLGHRAGHDTFWHEAAKKFILHAITLLRLTNPPGEPPSFRQVGELVRSNRALADRIRRVDPADPASEPCLQYFALEWQDLPPETRGGIQPHVSNLLEPFFHEPFASFFSGRSTCRLADVLKEGKILYVNLPLALHEVMSRVVGTFVKLEFYREVLRALNKERCSLFFCDEFQCFSTTGMGKGDNHFFALSRQSNHANLIATQGLSGLLAGGQNERAVLNLLGQCALKVFLCNDDPETNHYASRLWGDRLVQQATTLYQPGRWHAGAQTGSQPGWEPVVRPEEFARLAESRPTGPPYCESLVYRGGRAAAGRSPRKLRWKFHPLEA